MRAAVIYGHGDRDQIRIVNDYPDPVPEPGWVRLRVRATSLNFHDVFSRRGMPGIKIPLPLIIGTDIAGEIDALGDGVQGWNPGERVLVDPMPCEGSRWKFVGEQFDGGRAEYCCVHASQLMRLPAEVSFERAAALPLAYATAHRMLVTRGRLRAGETVLVIGASGGVGTGCVMLAKQMGCTVIACAGSNDKLEKLRQIGADHRINYRERNMREAVHAIVGKPRLTGVGGVDVAVNYSGGKTWKETILCLKTAGRLLTCGATAGFDEEIDVRYVFTYEHEVLGSTGWRRSDLEALLKMTAEGRLVPAIEHVLPLDDLAEAERMMEEREVFGKIVIRP
ncbi:MAG: zinc-binding dehydrogenase [Proteobacteria bacterium]|nr:zinc-binding dehydrogenase [Pseudomonadota bacterium]